MRDVVAVWTLLGAEVEIGKNLLTFLMLCVTSAGSIVAAVAALRGNRQLKPNGGHTVRDSLDRIEHNTHATTVAVAPEAAVAPPPTPPAGIPVTSGP